MSENFLTFTKKQTTILTSLGILSITFVFTIGYIIGQRRALSDFSDQVKEDAFVDKIKYSMYSSYKSLGDKEEQKVLEQKEDSLLKEEKATPDVVQDQDNDKMLEVAKSDVEEAGNDLAKKYHAQLVSFNNYNQAKRFAEKIMKLDIKVNIIKKHGRNATKSVTWYQVVTQDYKDKQDLLKDIEKIKMLHKLNKIRLVEN